MLILRKYKKSLKDIKKIPKCMFLFLTSNLSCPTVKLHDFKNLTGCTVPLFDKLYIYLHTEFQST